MKKLPCKHVFVPADKAANNIIMVWKIYYIQILKNELDTTSSYTPAQMTKDNLQPDNI